jgi:hypothetical protein
MDQLEEKRLRLLKTINQAIDLVLSNGDVKYIMCFRLRDGETQKLLTGMMTNLSYQNERGSQEPATPGMLLDILLEAMLDDHPMPKFPDTPKNSRIN